MVLSAKKFTNRLGKLGYRFDCADMDDGGTRVIFHYKEKDAYMFFDAKGTHVSIREEYAFCPDERIPDMLIICNSLNDQYNWLKFFVNKRNYVAVADDAVISVKTAADECLELLSNVCRILDEVGPIIDQGLKD